MANLRLIKRRIKTTQNIAQITRAMEMVAALKMRRAQDQALSSRPYTEKANAVLANLVTGAPIGFHPLFSSPKDLKEKKEKVAVLIITPNRGLCGSLITNIFREVTAFTNQEKEKEFSFISYGKKARDFLINRGLPMLADFEAAEPPTFEKAVDIFKLLSQGFLTGDFQKTVIVYAHFQSTMQQAPTILPLLPLGEEIVSREKPETLGFEYLFEPSANDLLDAFLPHFLEIKIYHAIIEAYASEQSARMMAMSGATENAKEIMTELTLVYNKERQQVITNEISDIVTAQLGLEAH